jgi:transcription termination factor Rho
MLLTAGVLAATRALRRALDSRDSEQAIDMLLDGLRKTRTNAEFLAQLKIR